MNARERIRQNKLKDMLSMHYKDE